MKLQNSLFAAFAVAVLASSGTAADRVDSTTLNGKVLFGYQGWFDCPMQGIPGSRWSHWSHGFPSPETLAIDLYPDLSEFPASDLCAVPGMTLGSKPAYLFSSKNANVVLRHFTWMQNYNLDGVLVQRFVGDIARRRASGDLVLKNVMAAAAKTGRTFAIEYDISGGKPDTFFQILQEDWKYLVDVMKITVHPNYLHHNGKPVLSIWGMGLGDAGHQPEDPVTAKEIVYWFESGAAPAYQVTYIGGTPSRWRTLTVDSRQAPGWADAYAAMDVVQPWTVGRYGTMAAADQWKEKVLEPDIAQLKANHQLYMPVIFPGFSWFNLMRSQPDRKAPQNQIPRNRGEFLWRQAYNAKTAGATVLKIAMFDEVNEGTAIFKAAAHRKDAPEQGYWLTLDADGAEVPSDWYLRLADEITRMFHGEIAANPELPRNPGSRK